LRGYFESDIGSFSRRLLDFQQGNAKYHISASAGLTLIFVLLHLLFGLDGNPFSRGLRILSGAVCMVFIVSLMVMHTRYLFNHTEGRLTIWDVW